MFKWEGTWVNLWLIHVDVWQKPTQYCKAIILQLKINYLGWEDPLEKEMATQFSIFAWEIPWTEEPGKLQSMGLQKNWTQLSD